jgi:hypothetical protein
MTQWCTYLIKWGYKVLLFNSLLNWAIYFKRCCVILLPSYSPREIKVFNSQRSQLGLTHTKTCQNNGSRQKGYHENALIHSRIKCVFIISVIIFHQIERKCLMYTIPCEEIKIYSCRDLILFKPFRLRMDNHIFLVPMYNKFPLNTIKDI